MVGNRNNAAGGRKVGDTMKGVEVTEDFTLSLENVPDLPVWLRGLDDGGVSAMSGYVLLEGEYRWFCNERWAHLFMDQKEAQQLLDKDAMLPWYLMSG